MKNRPKVLICNNCKRIWLTPCNQCPSCKSTTLSETHDSNFAQAKGVRFDAIQWWFDLNIFEQCDLTKKYESCLLGKRNTNSLTGREIELLFTKEFMEAFNETTK